MEFTHLEGDRFPNLKDTRFPNIDTVDVYAFKNTFDYKRWKKDTIVRLVNVLWDSTYNDVPLFDTKGERDNWFDSLTEGYAMRLDSAARIVPEGYVKVPLPYDIATRYNYLYVELPIATSESEPIDYETDAGVRRWYFFVDRVEYGAQNSTHVYLTLDYWTTFHNDVHIRYMMLERGHAPVAATDVDAYLADPMRNNQYLLAPDVDFGYGSIVRHSEMIPFGNGTKYLVFATMCTRENLLELGSVGGIQAQGWTPPTFSDAGGYQMTVGGYNWGSGLDYTDLKTPVHNSSTTLNRLPSNVSCWAIPADECFGFSEAQYGQSFLVRLSQECPAFIQTVLACFMVDESMITFNFDPVTIAGHQLRYCRGATEGLSDIELSKSDFAFPSRYESFAKLYTYPYSVLELTDNDGRSIEVRVEDTSGLAYRRITALGFPLLDMRILFEGIAGRGSDSYTWVDLADGQGQINIGKGDWAKCMFDWPIPTYALYMDGETAYNLRNQDEILNGRIDALTAYHASQREANCVHDNQTDMADSARTNAYDAADTAYDNNEENRTNLLQNTLNAVNTSTANTNAANANGNANVAYANSSRARKVIEENHRLENVRIEDNTLVGSTAVATQIQTATTTTNNNTASLGTSVVQESMSMATTGMTMGAGGGPVTMAAGGVTGAVIGYAAGKITAGMGIDAASANAIVAMNCEANQADNTKARNRNVEHFAEAYNNAALLIENDNASTQQSNNAYTLTQQTINNNNLAADNATNTAAAMRANAGRNRTTAKGNADRTRTTTIANADRTRGTATDTNQELLAAAQDKAHNRYDSARNAQPQAYGAISGDPTADYFRTRGVQVKVRTESDSAIAQAGDHFARYGYALNQNWDVGTNGLCPMTEFCYWKAKDLWIDDRVSSTNDAGRAIERIFLDGVTVWRNPSKIGRVSIYDNEPIIELGE